MVHWEREMAITVQRSTAADQKARYDEHGYVTFPDLLTRGEVDVLQAALGELLAEAAAVPEDVQITEKFSFTRSSSGERTVRRIFHPIAHHQAFMDLVSNPKLLDAVETLIGPNIQVHHTKLNMKPPASREARF